MRFLDRLSDAYYRGEPLVSNELFDELAKKFDYQGLGTSTETEVKHEHRMFSLQKVYPGEKIPFEGGYCSPKLDGAAIEATYRDGVLVWAATRGDGIRGQDITDKASVLLPTDLPRGRGKNFQVVGEVVTRLGMDNLRNYASGALNLKDIEEFKSRDLYFVAYDMVPSTLASYENTLRALSEMGFRTLLDDDLDQFPTDGTVVRINDNEEYAEMGFTAKHPRGAYALKENKQGVRTTLRRIVWQVGRSGVVSPVCIFDPVDVDGATVSRATGHNWAHIEALGLEPDCQIEVIRAGEIIPRVVRKIDAP